MDHGTTCTGLAISGNDLRNAAPLALLGNPKLFVKEIEDYVRSHSSAGVVFGWPLTEGGVLTRQCEIIYKFAKEFEESSSIPVTFWNERRTTVDSRDAVMRKMTSSGYLNVSQYDEKSFNRGHFRKRKKTLKQKLQAGRIDDIAAMSILQDFLDYQKRGL